MASLGEIKATVTMCFYVLDNSAHAVYDVEGMEFEDVYCMLDQVTAQAKGWA